MATTFRTTSSAAVSVIMEIILDLLVIENHLCERNERRRTNPFDVIVTSKNIGLIHRFHELIMGLIKRMQKVSEWLLFEWSSNCRESTGTLKDRKCVRLHRWG